MTWPTQFTHELYQGEVCHFLDLRPPRTGKPGQELDNQVQRRLGVVRPRPGVDRPNDGTAQVRRRHVLIADDCRAALLPDHPGWSKSAGLDPGHDSFELV